MTNQAFAKKLRRIVVEATNLEYLYSEGKILNASDKADDLAELIAEVADKLVLMDSDEEIDWTPKGEPLPRKSVTPLESK